MTLRLVVCFRTGVFVRETHDAPVLKLQLTGIVSLKTDGLPVGSYAARYGFNFIRVWGLDACTDFRCF